MSGDYLAQAPEAVGLWQYPNGSDYYRYLIKVNTTLDLTPEEIHQIGFESVERNNKQLEKIRGQVGFEGTLEEFRSFLKTDERFFPKSAEQIGAKLNGYIAGMEENIDVRKFHEAILGSGSLPFPILEKHIEWFIRKELKTDSSQGLKL